MSRAPRAPRRLAIAAVALSVAGVTACGSDGTDKEVAAGDPSDAYRVIAAMHEASTNDVQPHNLAEALPNRQVTVSVEGSADVVDSFTDVVVTGPITSVTPDEGIYHPDASATTAGDKEAQAQAQAQVVGFDNPDAQERVAIVTMQVDWSAGEKVGPTLQFRIGVPVDTDANKFLAGVRGIDDAVVLLNRFPDGRYKGDYYPILDFAGLGSVGDDGSLAFDALGDEESTFLAEVNTLDELKAEASKPETKVRY